jgi:hypothetical protein
MPAQSPIARRETEAGKTESGGDARERAIVNEFGSASSSSNNQVSPSYLWYDALKRAETHAHRRTGSPLPSNTLRNYRPPEPRTSNALQRRSKAWKIDT